MAVIERIVNVLNEWLDELTGAGKVIERSPVTRGDVLALARRIAEVLRADAPTDAVG